jgi:hypothetical protein
MSDMTFQQLAGEYFQLFDERHYAEARPRATMGSLVPEPASLL